MTLIDLWREWWRQVFLDPPDDEDDLIEDEGEEI